MSMRGRQRARKAALEAKKANARAAHLQYHQQQAERLGMDPRLLGQVPDSVKYRQLIMQTLTQLNNTNSMIQDVRTQADEAGAAGDMEKVKESERLVMHLDNKSVTLLSIVATYEVAFQGAIANERNQRIDNESKIVLPFKN